MTDEERDEVINLVRRLFIESGSLNNRVDNIETNLQGLLDFLERDKIKSVEKEQE